MFRNLWYLTQFYAYCCRICIFGKVFVMTSGTIILLLYKFSILNIIAPLNLHYPSPHKFYSISLHSGSWDTKSIRELVLQMNKDEALLRKSVEQHKSVVHELKMLDKAKSLDDKLTDKQKNGEMNTIIEYYATFFDEDSGNTRQEGIEQVHHYLKEEAKSHYDTYKNLQTKLNNIKKEIDKRKAVEENKKAVEENKNSFSILPIITINSFTIIRIFFSIFSCFIYFKFIDFNLNYLIPNILEVTIPMILTSIVLFVWEYYRLYSKVRKYYKVGKIFYMFCKEKLLLIIPRANNFAGKYDGLFNFIATNPLSIVVYSLVVYSLVLLLSVVLVYYCGDFSPYEYYSCHIACDAPRAWGFYFQDNPSPQMEH